MTSQIRRARVFYLEIRLLYDTHCMHGSVYLVLMSLRLEVRRGWTGTSTCSWKEGFEIYSKIGFVCEFARLWKTTIISVISVCLSVCPSAWKNSSHSARIFMKFDIRILFGICWKTSRLINPLATNDVYISRTAQLTSRRYILNIYSTNILTEYFKHAAHSPFFLFKMPFIS
jgi:hypothetical protein